MPSFNRVTLIGNLTRDPETKQLPSGTSVAEFGLASSRKFKTQDGEEREETCFVDCAAFGRQAEVIQQYCRKGKAIFVEGRLKYDQWDDKATGAKRSKLSVVVENFQFLGAPEHGDGGGGEHRERDAGRSQGQPGGNRGGDANVVRPRRQTQLPFNKPNGGAAAGGKKFKEADIPF